MEVRMGWNRSTSEVEEDEEDGGSGRRNPRVTWFMLRFKAVSNA